MWCACRQGLAELTDGLMRIHFPDVNFGSIVEDTSGRLWFGTRSHGVYAYDGANWSQRLAGRDVRPDLIGRAGRIWSVTDANGVYVFDNDSWSRIGADAGLANETVYDVTEAPTDPSGSHWATA